MARQRMNDADRARYGGPEWLPDERETANRFDDADYDRLVDIEAQLQAELKGKFGKEEITFIWVLYQLLGPTRWATSIPMTRVRLWLALVAEGVDVKLADFKPKVFEVTWEKPAKEDEQGDPPAGTPESSDTSTSTPAASPASEPSTSASTPGPDASTA